MATRLDILLRRAAIAKAFGGDAISVKAFEEQQELLAGHPDEIALAQQTANTANTTANSADGKANAIKAAPIVTMAATSALSAETVLSGALIVSLLGYTPKKTWVAAPATASDPGTAGDFAYDASWLYICVATDTWVRTALATF